MRLLPILLLFSLTSFSQNLKELTELRNSITINQAEKYLTEKGFKYDRLLQNKDDGKTTIFFRREGISPESDAVVTLSRKNSRDTFDIGYIVRSVNVFNALKKECESLSNVEMALEETTDKDGYSRYFLYGPRSFVFTISPEDKKVFFIYSIHIF